MPDEKAATKGIDRVPDFSGKTLRRAELILLALLVALPIATENAFLVDRIGRYLLLAVFALSVDLIWGYGGMFTFGQAAFFGGAGYAVGILSTREAGILPLPLGVTLVAAVIAVQVSSFPLIVTLPPALGLRVPSLRIWSL